MLSFKEEKFSLHLTKYVKRYSTELNHQPMMFICVLFGFNLTKAFQDFFTVKVDLKNSFAKMLNHEEKDVFCAQWSRIFCL